MALLVLLGLAAAVGLWLVGVYNGLVNLRQRCRQAFSDINVQLKQRHDLVPNLVETVKGYASHEKETLDAVIRARQAGMNAQGVEQQAQAENMISGALRQLFALSEAYPDLKANQNFAQLQEELSSTENKIAFARQHYNSDVGQYNTRIEVFPDNLIAVQKGFQRREFFELEDEAQRQAPEVKF